jgi:hypothetical protein
VISQIRRRTPIATPNRRGQAGGRDERLAPPGRRDRNERERLEAQWSRGDDVSTEDLRVALKRYRSFFDRLLSA